MATQDAHAAGRCTLLEQLFQATLWNGEDVERIARAEPESQAESAEREVRWADHLQIRALQYAEPAQVHGRVPDNPVSFGCAVGASRRSTTATSTSLAASSAASISPVGPAPATRTSAEIDMLVSFN
ncbi:hypothetical protein GCM10028798_24400 [Humibacter antri]